MKHIITIAAVIAAVLTVVGTRFVLPVFKLTLSAIEQSFKTTDETLVLEITPAEELTDLQTILDDEDAERATELLQPAIEEPPTPIKQAVGGSKPRRRTRKTAVATKSATAPAGGLA